MDLVGGLEAVAGGLLLFFLPGFAFTRAVFPDWRLRGPGAARRALVTGTLSFVLSLVLTLLVGYALLTVRPGGFVASWCDPVLELALLVVAGVAGAVGWWEGAYAKVPPPPRRLEEDSGNEGAWELSRARDRLGREERSLAHRLRVGPHPEAASDLKARLEEVREERERLQREREAEYDG